MTGPNLWIITALGFASAIIFQPAAAQDSSVSKGIKQNARHCSGTFTEDRLTTVSADGDLVLANGQLAKLSGLRLPETSPHRLQALEILRAYSEKSVAIERLGERDRWERLPVRIKLSSGKIGTDLSHVLVEAGLAVVDPGANQTFYQAELLALEETAREQRLGLWAEARYNPIPAERTELLQERVGSFVIVEGRVRSVGERKQRIYLNFGGHWAEDFTIIIPRRVWTLMTERGLGAEALKGRKIRARGILQSWQGTALTIEMPEMIERLEGHRLAR
jgi:hypothetical protein